MYLNPISRVFRFVTKKRATRQLSRAIMENDVSGIRKAFAAGADPSLVCQDLNDPDLPYEFHVINGALELAVYQRLPAETFAVLLEEGARPRHRPLCQGEDRGWELAGQIEAMCQAFDDHAVLEQNTAPSTHSRVGQMRL